MTLSHTKSWCINFIDQISSIFRADYKITFSAVFTVERQVINSVKKDDAIEAIFFTKYTFAPI